MSDLVERLRMWPATPDGSDGLNSRVVEVVMREAAAEIERLTAAYEPAIPVWEVSGGERRRALRVVRKWWDSVKDTAKPSETAA